MTKYVICQPEGGLNDILCQISKCIKYCKKTNRILIIDTVNSSTFKIEFDVFFKTFDKNVILSNAKEISDNLLTQSSSIFPKINYLDINNFKPRYKLLYNYHLNEIKLTFDFEKNYDEIVLLHHQCGGGHASKTFFDSFYLTNLVCDMLFDRINKIPIKYTGFHFRGTDMRDDYEHAFSLLHEINGPVFLASDSYSFIKNAKIEFGKEKIFTFSQIPDYEGKAIHHHYNNISLDTKKQLNFDCILDLIMLALSQNIKTTKTKSGFSELAKHFNKTIDVSFFEIVSSRLIDILKTK